MDGRSRLACALTLVLVAVSASHRPARADFVAEIRTGPNPAPGTPDTRLTVSLRADRARVEMRGALSLDGSSPPSEVASIAVVRGDLGVSWLTDAGDTTYVEAPWPDTLPAPAWAAAGPNPRETREIARGVSWDTIAGRRTEHVVVLTTPSAAPLAKGSAVADSETAELVAGLRRIVFRTDLWLAGLAPGMESAWKQFLMRPISTPLPAYLPGPAFRVGEVASLLDSLPGVPLRCEVRMGLRDSLGTAPAATPAQGVGSALMGSYEVVSLREERVPDERYRIPPGYRKKPRFNP